MIDILGLTAAQAGAAVPGLASPFKSQLSAPGSVCAERYVCISPGSPGVPGHFSAHIFRVVFLVEDALISPFL